MEKSMRHEAELVFKKINNMCYHDMKKTNAVDKNCANLLSHNKIKNTKYDYKINLMACSLLPSCDILSLSN